MPATVGKLRGAEVAVTGMTAQSKDFLDVLTARLPLVFGFVPTLAFLLLLVTFRSPVVPIKAIVLNLLSVGAAYGLMVPFRDPGWGMRPDEPQGSSPEARGMPLYLLQHTHAADECAAAFAAWRGFVSPLRHHDAPSTCLVGGHELWWRVEAGDRHAALAFLPPYVAARTEAVVVREVRIP